MSVRHLSERNESTRSQTEDFKPSGRQTHYLDRLSHDCHIIECRHVADSITGAQPLKTDSSSAEFSSTRTQSPLVWPTITKDGVTRPKEYTELTPTETIQADCDIKEINIILQGLLTEIYALVSQHCVAKDIWEKIRLLIQGTSLTKQERECKLYDEFDKFTYKERKSFTTFTTEISLATQ
ncbi:hypothetical protein Tco_0925190 [Tanacetum coccineum]|uniref:Uncharacterized protein n=1 Tax=Tanacetum coccineum TaxID=301880 RepID=A0ABQ5D929_9ASTR